MLVKPPWPIILAQALGVSASIATLVGMCALIGHMYPIFYQFQGGKGIAPMIGMTLALDLLLGSSFIACWLCIAFLFRYSSLAALGARPTNTIIRMATRSRRRLYKSTYPSRIAYIWSA